MTHNLREINFCDLKLSKLSFLTILKVLNFRFFRICANFLGHKWTKIKIVVLESTFLTNCFHVKSEWFFSFPHCVPITLTISLKNLWWKCFIFFLTKSRILETFVKMTHRDLCVWKLNQEPLHNNRSIYFLGYNFVACTVLPTLPNKFLF